jgi:HAD superfamily hydrolase (TIGR01509 family)
VVFDFDGVLADTERLHYGAFRDVLATRGWTLDEPAYFERYLGFDDAGLVSEFARDQRLPLAPPAQAAIVREKTAMVRGRLRDHGLLYPGAAAAVARLGSRYRLAVASGSLAEEIRMVLDAAAILPAFQAIIGADDVVRTKPAPDPYLAAVRALEVAPGAAVAVEDSHWGLVSARTAGLRTIAVATSYPAAALADADVVIASIDELTIDLVERLLAP